MIFIGMPTTGYVHAKTAECLANMIMHESDLGDFLVTRMHETTYIGNARAELVQQALAMKAEYVLFIDSDMVFPDNTWHWFERSIGTLRTVTRENPKPLVIAANYRRRRGTLDFTAIGIGGPISSVGKKELEEVDYVGMGLTLIDCDVFKRIQTPWFDHDFFNGEDIKFCDRCHEAGIPIFVNHDLSQHVGHIRSQVLTVDGVE